MELFGDLERWVANNLYPWRIPLTIVLIAVVSAAGVILVRRGAHRRLIDVTRARPLAAGTLLVAVLAIGGPATWYLASPIWVRSTLHETDLVALPVAGAIAESATESRAASGARLLGQGEISGADTFHFGRGRAELISVGSGHVLQLREFSVRNGPDLYVYLSSSGERPDASALKLGKLKATDGEFAYDIPAGTELPTSPHLVIWCDQFAVLFASGRLAPDG